MSIYGHPTRQCGRREAKRVGDWINYGEKKYGQTYEQALALTDKSYESVRKASEVAKRFEIGRRRPLPFAHHQEVAWLDPSQQDAILDQAEREGSFNGVDADSEHDIRRISPKVAGSMLRYPLIPFYPF